jgi:hypothetical protein
MRNSLAIGLVVFIVVYAVIRIVAVRWLPSALAMDAFVALVAAPLAVLLGRYFGRVTFRGVGLCSLALQLFLATLAGVVYVVAGYRGEILWPQISAQILQQHAPAIIGALLIAVLSPVVWLWAISKFPLRLWQSS